MLYKPDQGLVISGRHFFHSVVSAVISKGMRCSRTAFFTNKLTAVDMLNPAELQNTSKAFFKSASIRIHTLTCAILIHSLIFLAKSTRYHATHIFPDTANNLDVFHQVCCYGDNDLLDKI